MKLLLVVPTLLEARSIVDSLGFTNSFSDNFLTFKFNAAEIDVIITQPGIFFTTYSLTEILAKNEYQFVIQAGIAGSFIKSIEIGNVVCVETEVFADFGIESENEFVTVFEKNLIEPGFQPFTNGKLVNKNFLTMHYFTDFKHLKLVNAITVNKVSGKQSSIEFLQKKFNPDIETMEGAAFFFVCLLKNVPFVEIRAISNYVETRNVANWNIPLALKNLGNELSKLILQLSEKMQNNTLQ